MACGGWAAGLWWGVVWWWPVVVWWWLGCPCAWPVGVWCAPVGWCWCTRVPPLVRKARSGWFWRLCQLWRKLGFGLCQLWRNPAPPLCRSGFRQCWALGWQRALFDIFSFHSAHPPFFLFGFFKTHCAMAKGHILTSHRVPFVFWCPKYMVLEQPWQTSIDIDMMRMCAVRAVAVRGFSTMLSGL